MNEFDRESALRRFREHYHALGLGGFEKFEYSKRETVVGLDLAGKRVLDVGCGDGMKGIYMALKNNVAEWIGLDEYEGEGSDRENRDRFQRNLAAIGPAPIKQVVAPLEDNPFEDHMFDVVIAIDACHHFIETQERMKKNPELVQSFLPFFLEFRRVLKPGGILLMREALHHNITEFVKTYEHPIDWTTKHNPEDWTIVLRKAGFGDIRWRHYVPYRLRHLAPLLSNRVANTLMKSRYSLVAVAPK